MSSSTAVGIDIHGHAVPESFLSEMARTRFAGVEIEANQGRYVVTFPNGNPLRPCTGNMIDFVERTAWLDRQGLRQQIVGPWLDVQGHDLPPADGAVWVRELNNAIVEAAGNSAGRVRPHATLHLADADAASRELERAVRHLGMSSCMIPTNFPGGHLAEARYDALWECAESLQAPVVLHPPTVAPSGCLFGGDMPDFRTVYGRLIDTTLTAARLIVAGVFNRFPRLQIVLVHGGGMLTYQTGRFEHEYGEKLNGASPTDQVRRFYYDTTLMSGLAIRMLTELVGSGRVMLGSDYGAGAVERGMALITDGLRDAGLDDASRNAILRTNAQQIFRLDPDAN
jgi:aminocarboxymuconate-semialdehyde decarboxylase